jgi:hypothetical protein
MLIIRLKTRPDLYVCEKLCVVITFTQPYEYAARFPTRAAVSRFVRNTDLAGNTETERAKQ